MTNDDKVNAGHSPASGDDTRTADTTTEALKVMKTAGVFAAGLGVGAAAFATGAGMEHEAQMRKLREEYAVKKTQDQVGQATSPVERRQQEMKRFVEKRNAAPESTDKPITR